MPTVSFTLYFYERGTMLSIGEDKVPHIVKEIYIKAANSPDRPSISYFALQEDGLHGKIVYHGDRSINGDISHLYETGTFKPRPADRRSA